MEDRSKKNYRQWDGRTELPSGQFHRETRCLKTTWCSS